MPARTRKIRHDEETRAYVYLIHREGLPIYVGKGTGRRLQNQRARFEAEGRVLEWCASEDEAYEREVYWIARLTPPENLSSGGGGSRKMPGRRRSLDRETRAIMRFGPRRAAAKVLLSKIDERNCGAFGLSKVDVNRWREVANGPWS